MTKPAIFVGPTLSGDPILKDRAFRWLPPAGTGDVYRAARAHPLAIGLVDGLYESRPAVWHKEILWALSNGIYVFGAASMGALRAAELAPFGMTGVGRVYEQFRDGVLEDDDEVAVVHAPKELDYRPLCEAMVDIRATLERAHEKGVVPATVVAKLTRLAKTTFFKDRAWGAILAAGLRAGIAKADIAALKRWLPANLVGQKRHDALAMIEAMRAFIGGRPPPRRPAFVFQRTANWQALVDSQRR